MLPGCKDGGEFLANERKRDGGLRKTGESPGHSLEDVGVEETQGHRSETIHPTWKQFAQHCSNSCCLSLAYLKRYVRMMHSLCKQFRNVLAQTVFALGGPCRWVGKKLSGVIRANRKFE